ncbi:hypothetical protein LCGC14_1487860 [marine sediment metagenome]|uniref:Uncharacterized protein n=1 Tax=marine sediment metagenome TaxID=412755 RepID=A0A0F9J8E2_9ZZZZ
MVDEKEVVEEEPAAEDSGDGDKSETTELIEQQNQRIKELETEKQQRAVEDAKKQLAGRAEAGKPAETDEEKIIRESKELLSSVGMDDMDFK